VADEVKMTEFVKNEFNICENELVNGLPISEIRSRRSISNEEMGKILKEQNGDQQIREETIAIPMRLTEDMLKTTVAKCQLSGNLTAWKKGFPSKSKFIHNLTLLVVPTIYR
jgi:hypothetical protein